MRSKFLLSIIIFYIFFSSKSFAYNENIKPIAVPSGYGFGYNNVYQGKGAFEREFTFDGNGKVIGYSLDFNESINMDSENYFATSSFESVEQENIYQIGYLVKNFNNVGNMMSDKKSESVARQIAIWSIGGSFVLENLTNLNYPIMKRAEELITFSKGKEYRGSDHKFSIIAKTNNENLEIVIKNSDKPFSEREISLLINNKNSIVRTDNDGKIIFSLDNLKEKNNIEYSFNYNVPSGTILIANNGGSIITINDSVANISGSLSIDKKVVKKVKNKISNIPKIIDKTIKKDDIINYIEGGKYYIIDTSSSKTFEKRHILDSINYYVGSKIPLSNIDKNSNILIIGENVEDILNVRDELKLNKYNNTYYYTENYDYIFDNIDIKKIIYDNKIADDPSNTVLIFDNEILEKSDNNKSSPLLLILGILLLILSITAALIRVKHAKK